MSPRSSVLLNLLILVVHFVLIAAQTETEGRFMRATMRVHAIPAVRLPALSGVALPVRVRSDDSVLSRSQAAGGAIGTISHARLAKYLARLEQERSGSIALTAAQRDAVFEALAQCGRDYAAAAARWRSDPAKWRAKYETVEHTVMQRLRSAAIRDEAKLARLVRIVVSSAG